MRTTVWDILCVQLWSLLFSGHDGTKFLCAEICLFVSPNPKATSSLVLQEVGAAIVELLPQSHTDHVLQMPWAGQWAEERPLKTLFGAGHLDMGHWIPLV